MRIEKKLVGKSKQTKKKQLSIKHVITVKPRYVELGSLGFTLVPLLKHQNSTNSPIENASKWPETLVINKKYNKAIR